MRLVLGRDLPKRAVRRLVREGRKSMRGWPAPQVWLLDVDEFIAERGIGVHLTPIDSTSHYFLKPHVG